MKESDLFLPVKKWLENNDYRVFSEVVSPYSGKRADVVGVNNETSIIVELKLNLSLELLTQAIDWTREGVTNYVYIAVPWRESKKSIWNKTAKIESWLVKYICKTFNVGVLFIEEGGNELYINEKPYLIARYQRIPKKHTIHSMLNKYRHEYETSELLGGQSGGGYITEYRVTINRVKEFLQKAKTGRRFDLYWYEDGRIVDITDQCVDGWVDIKTILTYCETHYASPKPSLSNALIKFENKWCETKKEKGKLYYRYRGDINEYKENW